jgi:hypothetical protein
MKSTPFARQLQRLRKVCLGLPDTIEEVSHGEPTFFVKKRVFAMFSNNHHGDRHVGVWLPAPPGLQEALIDSGLRRCQVPNANQVVGGRVGRDNNSIVGRSSRE